MRTIKTDKDGWPETGEMLPEPIAMAVQCPQCGVRRNQTHRGWCSAPKMIKLPVDPAAPLEIAIRERDEAGEALAAAWRRLRKAEADYVLELKKACADHMATRLTPEANNGAER